MSVPDVISSYAVVDAPDDVGLVVECPESPALTTSLEDGEIHDSVPAEKTVDEIRDVQLSDNPVPIETEGFGTEVVVTAESSPTETDLTSAISIGRAVNYAEPAHTLLADHTYNTVLPTDCTGKDTSGFPPQKRIRLSECDEAEKVGAGKFLLFILFGATDGILSLCCIFL